MHPQITRAVEYCEKKQINKAIFAVPFPLSTQDILDLKSCPCWAGMALTNPPPEITDDSRHEWLGVFDQQGGWLLPTNKGPIVLLGSRLLVTKQMGAEALRSGRFSILCFEEAKIKKLMLSWFLPWMAADQIRTWIDCMDYGNPVRRLLYKIARIPVIKRAWKRFFQRQGPTWKPASTSVLNEDELYQICCELIQKSETLPLEDKIKPVHGRVMIINVGLAAGGAERQIVNTLAGLKDSCGIESVEFFGEYLGQNPDLDFFLPEAEKLGVKISPVEGNVSIARDGLSMLEPSIASLFANLGMINLEETLNLIAVIRARRPEVVHAWQDQTSIKAGIAAVIAGVPKVILASRNVTPTNFTYYQEGMRAIYRALYTAKSVKLLNNSHAGAADYTRWLDLPSDSFTVVHNGVDFNLLTRNKPVEVQEYKKKLGIPEDCLVVGSIFRFWEEKRPMLWLKAAAIIAQQFPNTHFLLVGEGPLRKEMKAFLDDKKLSNRFHMPGAKPGVSIELETMDLFMLTSKFEGLPNVILEAQFYGLPVVATDAGGTREAFEQNVTGLLAEDPTPESLADYAGLFLASHARTIRANDRAPKFVSKDFGLDRMIGETLDLYNLTETTPND